jgi:hypothetical protein
MNAMSPGNGSLAGLSPDELRAAVREVLREVLPAGMGADPDPRSGGAGGDVIVSTDADLTALVRRVAALCEDPQQRAALQDGRHGFRLVTAGRGVHEPVAQRPPPPPTVTRIDRGAVTERMVRRAAAEGASLLLGRRAVLTPLARDKARSLGVEIGKEH